MVFQPIRCTAPDVTTGTGELLPRLFTIIPTSRDCYFLLHCYTLSDIFPLGRMVLCVARTFLSDTIVGTTDRPAGDKDTSFALNFNGSKLRFMHHRGVEHRIPLLD